MSETNSRYLTELPYANLTDSEFKALTASWSLDLSDCNIDLFDIVPNPDKFDERDPDVMLNSLCSQYFSFNKFNKSLKTLTNRSKSISLFHCNIRSLPKNLCLLEDFICSLDVKPDILAISETKLNSKTVTNIDIPRYQFFLADSETAAGGTGLYVSNNLHALCRPDIKFKMPLVESCWCEIISGKNKPNIIVGCIWQFIGLYSRIRKYN